MSHGRFGISTYVFHQERLAREHLLDVARHGFDAIELVTTRSHFDCADDQAVALLSEWLRESGLELHSIHAPVIDSLASGGQPTGTLSLAAADQARREAAVEAARAAARIATRIPFRYLVVHLGVVPGEGARPGDNQPDAARRSLAQVCEAAAGLGVRVAIEVIPNRLSEPAALVHLIENELDNADVGICLDYGHAHLLGDLGDAVETLSGHVWTTHLHDNHGRRDEHLIPFAGTIDWDLAMMETQKLGYDGVLMFEVAGQGNPTDVLGRTVKARERLAKTFITF